MHLASLIQQSSKSDKRRLNPLDECRVPCQLEHYWIPFSKVLELSEIPSSLHFFIRSKSGDMVNVGKCAGNCFSSMKPLYQDPVRSTISRELPYCDIKDIKTICVPIEYDDIETEIVRDEDIVQGPTIKNLVIRSCACAEVQTCN